MLIQLKFINDDKINFCIILLFFCSILFSQEPDSLSDRRNFKHEIGGLGSFDSGSGISYRITFREKIKLQASTIYFPIPLFSNYIHFLTLGLSAQYVIFNLKRHQFYGYVGGHSIHTIDNSINPLVGLAGTGLGVNISVSSNLNIQIQFGYAIEYMNFDKIPVKGYGFDHFGFSPGVGVMYRLGKSKSNIK